MIYTGIRKILMLLPLMFLFAGCSGGGGEWTASPRTVSGYASKGIIKNGVVSIYTLNSDGSKGQKLSETTTDLTNGYYRTNVGKYYGPLIVEVSGSYTDEATGRMAIVSSTTPLKAASVPPRNSTPVTINVTALTEISFTQAKDQSGTQQVNFTDVINEINTSVSGVFHVTDILTTIPLDSFNMPASGVTADQQQYTLVLAAVSQAAANTLGAGNSSPTPEQLSTALSTALTDIVKQLPATANGDARVAQAIIANAALQYVNNADINTMGIKATDVAIQEIITVPPATSRKNVTVTIAVRNNELSVPVFGAVNGSMTVPNGMICESDSATGQLAVWVAKPLQVNSLVGGNFKSSSNILTVTAVNSAAFKSGDIMTVTCDVPSSMTPVIADFSIKSSTLDVNNGGNSLSGFYLEVSAVTLN